MESSQHLYNGSNNTYKNLLSQKEIHAAWAEYEPQNDCTPAASNSPAEGVNDSLKGLRLTHLNVRKHSSFPPVEKTCCYKSLLVCVS